MLISCIVYQGFGLVLVSPKTETIVQTASH